MHCESCQNLNGFCNILTKKGKQASKLDSWNVEEMSRTHVWWQKRSWENLHNPSVRTSAQQLPVSNLGQIPRLLWIHTGRDHRFKTIAYATLPAVCLKAGLPLPPWMHPQFTDTCILHCNAYSTLKSLPVEKLSAILVDTSFPGWKILILLMFHTTSRCVNPQACLLYLISTSRPGTTQHIL